MVQRGETASQARTLSAETLRSVMLAYAYSQDPGLLAFGDTLYNAMYGKAGIVRQPRRFAFPTVSM